MRMQMVLRNNLEVPQKLPHTTHTHTQVHKHWTFRAILFMVDNKSKQLKRPHVDEWIKKMS